MNLPTGNVTFLFTDIEGSAALAQRFPSELPDLLARHHAILNAAIQAHNGHVFQIIGDAFSAAFFTPWDALNAAIAAQRQLQRENWGSAIMRVRMGIHTGAAQAGVIEEKAGGYVGYLTLTRTQRVMSAAYGEQVLISHSSAQLVRPDLPPSVTLRDMGEHALKGLTEPERLWQPVAPELRTDFPPLKTGNAAVNTLPANLTPLIGREGELAQVQTLLSQPANRLITLTGMGGMGKTHFAQVVAAQLAPSFADGVMYVPLAPVRDADLVIPTIARAFGLQDSGGGAGLDALIKHLHDKVLLLVLDNFEQVVEAGHDLARLLQMAKQLKIIITSRVLLRVEGELAFALSPLARASAQDLFLARAQAVVGAAGYAAQANAYDAAISAICKPLEGIPLAIELAASQLRLYSPAELLQRLITPLKALSIQQRRLTKQSAKITQTLTQVLDRSYELLSIEQQQLFRGMGVFVGGATLEAIRAVLGPVSIDPKFDNFFVDDLLILINSSLLYRMTDANGSSYYVMHEIVREYAGDLAKVTNEIKQFASLHATYFAGLACEFGCLYEVEKTIDQIMYRKKVESALPNIRCALQWCQNQIEADEMTNVANAVSLVWKIVFGVRYCWQYWGYIHEANQATRYLYEYRHYLSFTDRNAFLSGLSDEIWIRSELPQQKELDHLRSVNEEGLLLSQKTNDLIGESWYLLCLGSIKIYEEQWDDAWEISKNAYDIGKRAAAAQEQSNPAYLTNLVGLKEFRHSANQVLSGIAQQLALMFEYRNKYDEAFPLVEESIALNLINGMAESRMRWLLGYGRILLGLGRRNDAIKEWIKAIKIIREIGSKIEVAHALVSVTKLMIMDKNWLMAARWVSVADTLRKDTGAFMMPTIWKFFLLIQSDITLLFVAPEIKAAWEAGKLLTHEQVLDEMLVVLTA